ncbi:sulfotransferase [Nocardioides sp. YIM 152588]|uniref:sulfotransferase family protein n=1 Tax=Nocardioides sp. YIM 152588 TaxID=3158259 RepID=UPI0032E47CD5
MNDGGFSALVVLDDLAAPRFSPGAAELLALMDSVADACPLDSAALHAQASAELGLGDFGPRDYEERLEVLLAAYRDAPRLSRAGRVNLHAQFLQLLKNRLLFTDLLRREPGIAGIELAPPVVIAGLPRTGTTHLLQLLAATGRFRTLPYWEGLEPFPLPGEAGVVPEPRRERTQAAVALMNDAMPHFARMHEMADADHVHEEIALLASDFSTMYFETLTEVPAWQEYYAGHDQAPHYRYLRLHLQALQHLRPGPAGAGRWLLKSPQHLEQLPVLAETFPGATVVITHRDPVHVVTSMATMVAYTDRMFSDPTDPAGTGRRWAARIERMLDALQRDRSALPPDRAVDLPFADLMADQLGAVERILAMAGERFDAAARSGAEAYLAGHAAGHLGRVDYRPELVGLDPDDLRRRFASYERRFLPSEEPLPVDN